MPDPKLEVMIDYTNHRGERAERRIMPIAIRFENNNWHSKSQWLLEAVDLDRGQIRIFAMAKVHSWKPHDSQQQG